MATEQNRASTENEIRRIVQQAIEEHLKGGDVIKTALGEERKQREQIEKRLNELAEENGRHRRAVEQMDRFSAIKSELQQLGVRKPELAFRLLKDEVFRGEDGQLYARSEEGEVGLQEFLTKFVAENPEFLPPRIAGGSGASGGNRQETSGGSLDLARIRPGMSEEDKERARREIARAAGKEAVWWL